MKEIESNFDLAAFAAEWNLEDSLEAKKQGWLITSEHKILFLDGSNALYFVKNKAKQKDRVCLKALEVCDEWDGSEFMAELTNRNRIDKLGDYFNNRKRINDLINGVA